MVTVATLVLLIKLGWWQLDRAAEKQQLAQQYQQRAAQQLQWPLPSGDLRGYGLQITGRWLSQYGLLLDNQVWQGAIGYRWLVPVEISPSQPWLLVDLGFVETGGNRQSLPSLPPLPKVSQLQGRLLQPGVNRLADQLLPEALVTPAGAAITRVQALNWQQLQQHWQQPIVAALLWLEQPQQLGFVKPWQPLNMGADKHRAYALQWFSLALALLIIVLVLWRKQKTAVATVSS